MPKPDIDALVMHLLDKYTATRDRPLCGYPNQAASEILRLPLSRIKRLRYEGGLKFCGNPEAEGRQRFVRLLDNAGLELDSKQESGAKIVFVVEDMLAKNWIQGKIKEHRGIFDSSFNSEIIKVDPEVFFHLLHKLLPGLAVKEFEQRYNDLLRKSKREKLVSGFKALLSSFVSSIAEAGGAAVTSALLALPHVGG